MPFNDWRIVLAVFLGGIALTVTRRWGNDDHAAGAGVAGATIIIVGCYLLLREPLR